MASFAKSYARAEPADEPAGFAAEPVTANDAETAGPSDPDGLSALTYRWLPPRQWELYAVLLHDLPAKDRGARFHGALSDQALDSHVAGLQWPANRILGALEDRRLVGAIEVALYGFESGNAQAEFSISVAADRQCRGIGKALMERALIWARNRWINRVHMETQVGNRRLCAIGRRFAGAASLDGEDINLAFALDPPDAATMTAEAVAMVHELARLWPVGWHAALPVAPAPPLPAIGWAGEA